MKKIIYAIVALIVIPIFTFIMVNIDSGRVAGEYTRGDLPAAAITPDNGFYGLLTMSEPAETDVESRALLDKYLDMYASGTETEGSETWGAVDFGQKWGHDYSKLRKEAGEATQQISQLIDFPRDIRKDLVAHLKSSLPEIEKLKTKYDYFLARYEKVITSPKATDFTAPWGHKPFPNLLLLLRASRLFTALNINDAIKGNWTGAVDNLLLQLRFFGKLNRSIRTVLTNLIGKAVMRHSLHALISIMNRPECPKEVFAQVSEGMPPLTYEGYGLRTAIIGASLEIKSIIDNPGEDFDSFILNFLLQENRTKTLSLKRINRAIKYEGTPPYKWDIQFTDLTWKPLRGKSFWWFRNGVGKTVLERAMVNFTHTIYKAYQLKAYYDLTRISAQLHRDYEPGKPVQEILSRLEAYKEPDLCSGKPYIWNAQKGVLYGIGIDRTDNNGTNILGKIKGSDYVIKHKI